MHTRTVAGLLAWVLLVVLSLSAQPARAVSGTLDNVPGSTLLLPYFEADLADPNGVTTLFTIQNTSATAILANVTLWTDAGVSSHSFNLYFTGYDVQSINVRDLFDGTLPITASAGQDPTDVISPKGELSQDINFASCNDVLPYTNPLPQALIDDLRAMHTGQPIPSGQTPRCAGTSFGDQIARGYITVDTRNACSADVHPDDPAYAPLLTQQDVFAGDFQIVHPAMNFAQGEVMPALERISLAQGGYSFYGAFSNGFASLPREPLPTHWAVPHAASEASHRNSDVIVWRDRKRAVTDFACDAGAQLNVASEAILHNDATGEHVATATNGQSVPLATQRHHVLTGTDFSGDVIRVPAKSGWLDVDLNHDQPQANPYGDVAQSYIFGVMSSEGRFSAAVPGVQLDPAATFTPPPPPRQTSAASQEDRP